MARVAEKFPRLAAEVADSLRHDGEDALADQVDTLEVVQMCGCGDSFCQSIYTALKPANGWGPGHRNVAPAPPWPGMLILDVVDDRITYIEVLDRHPLD